MSLSPDPVALLDRLREHVPSDLWPLVLDYAHTLYEWHQREAEEVGFLWDVPVSAVRSEDIYVDWMEGNPFQLHTHLHLGVRGWLLFHLSENQVLWHSLRDLSSLHQVLALIKATVSRLPLEQRPLALRDPAWLARARSRAASASP